MILQDRNRRFCYNWRRSTRGVFFKEKEIVDCFLGAFQIILLSAVETLFTTKGYLRARCIRNLTKGGQSFTYDHLESDCLSITYPSITAEIMHKHTHCGENMGCSNIRAHIVTKKSTIWFRRGLAYFFFFSPSHDEDRVSNQIPLNSGLDVGRWQCLVAAILKEVLKKRARYFPILAWSRQLCKNRWKRDWVRNPIRGSSKSIARALKGKRYCFSSAQTGSGQNCKPYAPSFNFVTESWN